MLCAKVPTENGKIIQEYPSEQMRDLWDPWVVAKWNNTPKTKGYIQNDRSSIEEEILLTEQALIRKHLEIEEYKKQIEKAKLRDDLYGIRDLKIDMAEAKRSYYRMMEQRQFMYWR